MLDRGKVERALIKTFPDGPVLVEGAPKCLKYVLRRGRVPLAVYYFDLAVDVDELFDVERYQEALLGDEFYSQPGPLQWSQYLVLVLPDQLETRVAPEVRSRILRNQRYARKYLVAESGLSKFASNMVNFTIPPVSGTHDVIGTWMRALDAHGLSTVYGEEPRTTVVQRYLNGESDSGSVKDPVVAEKSLSLPSLESLVIARYRNIPSGTFPLRQVNLLVGPNGSGKTSFLEAIELVLCGRTSEGIEDAELRLAMADGSEEEYEPHNQSKYRTRDLRLYGASYARDNKMPGSFERCNFFSTDAAYKLAYDDDAKDINEAFRRLAFGTETTRIGERIERFTEDFEKERKRLARGVEEARRREASATAGLSGARGSLESAQGGTELLLDAGKLLCEPQTDRAEALSKLTRVSVALKALTAAFNWIRPLTLRGVEEEQLRLEERSESLRKLKAQRSEVQERQRPLEIAAEFLSLSGSEILAVGPRALDDARRKYEALSELARIRTEIKALGPDRRDLPLEIKTLNELGAELERNLNTQVEALAEFKGTLPEGDDDLARMRALVRVLIEEHDLESCPVCRTQFGSGVLLGKLQEFEDENEKKDAQFFALRERVRRLEDEKTALAAQKELCRRFDELGVLFGLSPAAINAEARVIALRVQVEEDDDIRIQKAAGRFDETLRSRGMTLQNAFAAISRVEELVPRDSLGWDDWSRRVDAACKEAGKLVENSSRAEDDFAKSVFDGLTDFHFVAELLEERLGLLRSLQNIREGLGYLSPELDLSQHFEDLKVVTGRLERELTVAQRREERSKLVQEYQLQLDEVAAELTRLKPKLERATRAAETLGKLKKESGAQQMLREFVHKYRAAILGIFCRIHSPSEFDDIQLGVGDDEKKVYLRRLRTGEMASLHEISTGQRAALALSIFLALNESVRDRCSLMIIDDPVAHVDDLNILAFFDVLRSFALRDVQILFATADKRIAKLFEVKLGVLEDRYLRHELLPREELQVESPN